MRALALALLATSCDLANPCTAGEGSFDLYFAGDLEGVGRLDLDAIPRIAGAPALERFRGVVEGEQRVL